MTRYEVTLISRVIVNGVDVRTKAEAADEAIKMYRSDKTKYEVYKDVIVVRER